MNENGQKKVSARNFIAAAVFYILNVLLFPITLIGYVIWVGKLIFSGSKSGVSVTAQGPLSARWTEHVFGTRPDEPANRLMRVLPGVPYLGVYLTSRPIFLAHKLTGYVPVAFRYPFEGQVPPQYEASARITFFDNAVDRYLAEIRQFVILGAGFDTRAFRLPKGTQVKSFEVDAPKTQTVKREMLKKVGIDSPGVTFVSADFEKEDWLTRLVDAGFDPGKPALFLCEGVILYLDRAAVEDTLRKVAGTAKGSVIAFDYFTTEPLESQEFYWRFARASTKAAGEPIKFGVDSKPPSSQRLAELLQSCGLSLGEHRTLGKETEGKRAWGGFATAIVK
jgi:methyltransferase (TIGR00027 family)